MKTDSRVRYYVPEGTKAVKNHGFTAPDVDLIKVPYRAGRPGKGRNDSARSFVSIVAESEEKAFVFMFDCAVLMGLENSPVGKDRGIDESMLMTWKAGDREPAFRPTL